MTDSAERVRREIDIAIEEEDLMKRMSQVFENITNPTLLPGEKIGKKCQNVFLQTGASDYTMGELIATNYQVIFIAYSASSYDDTSNVHVYFPILSIFQCEKFGHYSSRGAYSYGFEISTKDFRHYRFYFSQVGHARREIYEYIAWLAFSEKDVAENPELFVYTYYKARTPRPEFEEVRKSGVLSLYSEYKRQGIGGAGHKWRISKVNKKYTLCDTYPRYLPVPAGISDDDLLKQSGFRTRNRIPAISWIHPDTGVAIMRCSQPQSGIMRARNEADEKFFREVVESTPNSNSIWFVDARPKANALGNTLKGSGYEIVGNYPNSHITFMNIENIHSLRASLRALFDLCVRYYGVIDPIGLTRTPGGSATSTTESSPVSTPRRRIDANSRANQQPTGSNSTPSFLSFLPIWQSRASAVNSPTAGDGMTDSGGKVPPPLPERGKLATVNRETPILPKSNAKTVVDNYQDKLWLSNLQATRWLEHVRTLLSAAVQVAMAVDKLTEHVCIHCSDGWDRTAQVTALAEILLDGYYRTRIGLAALIEKDWVAFGHRFKYRTGHGSLDFWGGEHSPTFLHFLDSLHQCVVQYPTAFEYSSSYLVFLAHHLYSCRYGTFLWDCEREMRKNKAAEKTTPIWEDLICDDQFENPFYVPVTEVLYPSTSMRIMKFWGEYFLHRSLSEKVEGMPDPMNEVASKFREMRQQCSSLEAEIGRLKAGSVQNVHSGENSDGEGDQGDSTWSTSDESSSSESQSSGDSDEEHAEEEHPKTESPEGIELQFSTEEA